MAPDGFPTNAIYGFIKMLAKIHSWLRPTHQVVIWDGGLASGLTQPGAAGTTLPVGVLTGLVGGPFFLALLLRARRTL